VDVEQIADLVAHRRAVVQGRPALPVDEDPHEPARLHPQALELHELQALGLDGGLDQRDDPIPV